MAHALFRQVLAILVAALPAAALAENATAPQEQVFPAPRPAAATPDLVFTITGGIAGQPAYFGSGNYEASATGGFSLKYLRLPGGVTIGSPDPDHVRYGFAPRGSFRIVKARTTADNPELAGLNDIDLAVEIGLGLGYTQRHFQAFAEARYGVVGHESWVGELGADVVARPADRLTLTAGPRLFLGDDTFASTYYGVTALESVASGGAFAPYSASGGALRAGFEVGATYKINDVWEMTGAMRYDRLLNDAADSPITAQGSADQFSARIGLTRRFSIDF